MTVARTFVPALLLTVAALPLTLPPASAQQAAPAPAPQAQAPAPQAQGGPPPPGQEPPCLKEFMSLRDATAKKAAAIQAASKRKAPPQEACNLFKDMVTSEAKFVKFAKDQGPWCGIPQQIVDQLGKNHEQTVKIRTQVCKVAAQGGGGGGRPAAPTLSDALGAPTTSSGNVRTGRGTFDTLTGTPLGRAQ
jgi:hypothetical protein